MDGIAAVAAQIRRPPGLRMTQGVVSAVSGPTCSVLIAGSTVAVSGVQHLNSCAPAVGDVVWIASDGADLWIIGTHGAPPPIDPALLPTFESYFTSYDTPGDPAAVTGLAGFAAFSQIILSWDLPSEAMWRTWEVYEGVTSGFTPTTPILTATETVVSVPHATGSGPWYYKVRAINSLGVASSDVQVGPFTLPAIATVDIDSAAVTSAKIAAAAIDIAKFATGIVPPRVVSSLPTLPDAAYPIGSTVFLTSNSCLYKTTTGLVGSWGKLIGAGDIVADSITAGCIAAGSITADELAAYAVCAKHMVVANFDNLVPNPTSEMSTTGKDCAYNSPDVDFRCVSDATYNHGSKCRALPGNGAGRYSYISQPIACTEGEQYYLSGVAKLSAAQPPGIGVRIAGFGVNAAGTEVTWPLSAVQSAATWGPLTATWTVPASVVSYRVVLWSQSLPEGVTGYFDDLLFRRMNEGSLIVDGAITAAKIAANTITANEIAANTITANEIAAATITAAKIAAGTITADRLAAGTITSSSACIGSLDASKITAGTIDAARINGITITGMTINASQIETAVSGARVALGRYDIGGGASGVISLFAGSEDEDNAAWIQNQLITGGSKLYIVGGNYGGGLANISLENTTTVALCHLIGKDAQLTIGNPAGGAYMEGQLWVTKAIRPSTNWASRSSDDGIWIQDKYSTSGRWKIYFDSNDKKLYVGNAAYYYGVTLA